MQFNFLFIVFLFSFLKIYFIDYSITLVTISPIAPLHLVPPIPLAITPLVYVYGSCISSLATPFPLMFLTFLCLFSVPTNLYFLHPAPYPPSSSFPLSTNNPPNDLRMYDSVPVLLSLLF